MAVGGHRDKIDVARLRELDDLIRWFTKREHGFAGETFIAELATAFFQISAVLFHFFALGEFELIEVSSHPAVGHVHEQQFRPRHPGERLNVTEDCFVGVAVFEGNENMLIHV